MMYFENKNAPGRHDDVTDADDAVGSPTAKTKRATAKMPLERTMIECRRRGWFADICERRIPFPRPRGTTRDLFGVIDVVAIDPSAPSGQRCIGIQATSAGCRADHRDKILAEPRARIWLRGGNRLELWSWGRRTRVGRRVSYELVVEVFTLDRDDWSPSALGNRDLKPDNTRSSP